MTSKAAVNALVLGVAIFALTGCAQISLLQEKSGSGKSATVENPAILGRARPAVVLDGRTGNGVVGESARPTRAEDHQTASLHRDTAARRRVVETFDLMPRRIKHLAHVPVAS